MLTYCVAIGALLFLSNLSLIFFLVVRQKHYGINDHLYFGVERQQGLDPCPEHALPPRRTSPTIVASPSDSTNGEGKIMIEHTDKRDRVPLFPLEKVLMRRHRHPHNRNRRSLQRKRICRLVLRLSSPTTTPRWHATLRRW